MGSKVYLSSVEGPNRRGRPLRRKEDRVTEYISEKGVRGIFFFTFKGATAHREPLIYKVLAL